MTPPRTRWELAGQDNAGYGQTFARRVAEGIDVDGEARFVDALAPRGARILDLGSGMGRVVVGFHLTAVKAGSRTCPADELHEPNDEYAVWVLARA